jgi:photosystem II stability/assembly factor-like uncharacterized protein
VGRYNECVQKWFALAVFVSTALAEAPVTLQYGCPQEDIDSFGLSCAPDEPCAVFLELSSAESAGARMFVTGNLHTKTTTLYGVLLASEDGGETWTEPLPRMRAVSLEQIEFLDLAHGWIAGQTVEPLPRDPFLMITLDGGKSWHRKAIFDDARFGSIAQFWFDSPTSGRLVIDHSGRHDVYQTNTGGEDWEMEQTSNEAITLKGRNLESDLRLRADGKLFHLERRGDPRWDAVASFNIHVADCK